jgi:MAF protein
MRKAAQDNPHIPGALVLASASPRRRALLARAGLSFVVDVPAVDETPLADESPAALVARLAHEKAAVVARRRPRDWVLAADTEVVLDGVALGKPASATDALETLARLRDRTHAVLTGVCLLRPDAPAAGHMVRTLVQVRGYAPAEVTDYVMSGAPLDKAGAYGIQDAPFRPVRAIRGCYTNVVGLPLCAVIALLAEGMEGLPASKALCPHEQGWIPPPVQ